MNAEHQRSVGKCTNNEATRVCLQGNERPTVCRTTNNRERVETKRTFAREQTSMSRTCLAFYCNQRLLPYLQRCCASFLPLSSIACFPHPPKQSGWRQCARGSKVPFRDSVVHSRDERGDPHGAQRNPPTGADSDACMLRKQNHATCVLSDPGT